VKRTLTILAMILLMEVGSNGSEFKSEKALLKDFILTCDYDIQHYTLQINLPMYNDSLYGHQSITVIRKSMTSDILILNAVYLDIDSVKVNKTDTTKSK